MFKRKRELIVVVATREPGVVAALEEATAALEPAAAALTGVKLVRREAVSLDGAYEALQGAHLAIVDSGQLAPGRDTVSAATLEAALATGSLITVAGAAFLADAATYLELALATTGLGAMLPPRAVAFTALAGGVGKTTLALATALAFLRATHLPAAVIELTPGPSALFAQTGASGADLYRAITQGEDYPTWRGVTLVPMAWDTVRLLPPEQVLGAWRAVQNTHIYVAWDAPAWHPLWDLVEAQRTFVLADQRPETQGAALYLSARLREEERDVALGLNRAGIGGALALPEKAAFVLKQVRDPLTLGPQVLRAVYPGWRGR
jgi:hypothetical protein